MFENAMGQFHEARDDRSQRELDQIEISYYLDHPGLRTLRELAEVVVGVGPITHDVDARAAPVAAPPAPPAPLVADCPLCGAEAEATGVTEVTTERTMREMACTACRYRFMAWRSAWPAR